MSSRAIRRAAERKAAKLAQKASRTTVDSPTINLSVLPVSEETSATLLAAAFDFTDEEDDALALTAVEETFAAVASASSASAEPAPESPTPISDARLSANRQNSLRSTGPRTSTGKSRSSLNAIKTGLTSRIVVLPTEDAAAYQQHLDRRFAKYSPATDDEHMLVQNIADTEWRLLRIMPLESAVYALGSREFVNEFADEQNPAARAALVHAKTLMEYRRDLSNIALQERRLRNHLEKDVAQLEALQKSRKDKRRSEIAYSIKLRDQAGQQGGAFQPSDCGFDFSNDEFEAYLDQTSTQFRLMQTRPDFDLFLATRRSEQKGANAS